MVVHASIPEVASGYKFKPFAVLLWDTALAQKWHSDGVLTMLLH